MKGDGMKLLFWSGLVVLVLGIVSLFVSIPHKETTSWKAGNVSVGLQTQHSEPVPLAVSIVLMVGGIGMVIVGGTRKS
jgi:hypothetical protein